MSTGGRRAGPGGGGNNSLSRVRVAVRVRPPAGKGADATAARCVVEDIDPEGESPPEVRFSHESVCKAFAFDHVFPSAATQEDVYASSLRPFLSPFLNGFNVTVIAYGQTGTGKTFTVGHHASLSPCPSPETAQSADKAVRAASPEDGLIPRFLIDLFEALRSEPSVKTIHVSFLEIYCDEIHDLLSNARAGAGASHGRNSMGGKSGVAKERPLIIREDEHRVAVQNLTQIQVETAAKALELMNIGRARQATGSNALNSQSSRSHAIYTIEVSRKFARDIKNAKLTFVDLAGSERLQKTNVQGMCMKESIQINVGLFGLSKVINALRGDRTQKRRQSMDSTGMNGDTMLFVPYRSSKLTRLLRDALGGNSMSLFIACVSPTLSNSSETLCTLQFADRVSCIENKAQKNVEALCPSGSSSPQRVNSPQSATASPRNSFRGRSASEIEIIRLQEQILVLKHQLDMATATPVELPVQCTSYEPVAPAPAPTQATGSKLTPPRVSGLQKVSARREPDSAMPATTSQKPPRPRSASVIEIRCEEDSSDGKSVWGKSSMLVRPRIHLSDRSPPRDVSMASPATSSPALAPGKPPRSSLAVKLFIDRLNASASAQSSEMGIQMKANKVESTESRLKSKADQQTADDISIDVQQASTDHSSDTSESPPKDDGAQPQSVDPEVIAKPQASPTQLQQPRIQVHHSRRQSPPPAFAAAPVSTKLQLFMESVKLPIRLSTRDRNDSHSSSPPRSPRSSPSSPSSASTSSVSPMSERRQSLETVEGIDKFSDTAMPAIQKRLGPSGGAVKSALLTFMEKVKPNGYGYPVEPPMITRQCGHELVPTEPEEAVAGRNTGKVSEPEHNLELSGKLLAESAEVLFNDREQLDQESKSAQSHDSRQEESDSIICRDTNEKACEENDDQASVSIELADTLPATMPQYPLCAPEAQQTPGDLCTKDMPSNSSTPMAQGADVAKREVAGVDPCTAQQVESSDDEQEYVFLVETVDEHSHRELSRGPDDHDMASTRIVASDATMCLDNDETRSSDQNASYEGFVPASPPPLSATTTLAPADAGLAQLQHYCGPIYPADPLDFEDFEVINLPTVDQGTQCDKATLESPTTDGQLLANGESTAEPADFIVDRRHWRDDVRAHFAGVRQGTATKPRRQKALRSARPHPFKWFGFADTNQEVTGVDNGHTGNNDANDDATSPAQEQRLEQLLVEMKRLVRTEIGQHSGQPSVCSFKLTEGRLVDNNGDDANGSDDESATVTVSAFLDDMTQLLDARSQCQQRVDVLKRRVRSLGRLLGSMSTPPKPIRPSSSSVSVDTVASMTDENLGIFTLGHQETLLRATLADGEAQVAARLQLRVHHFQQAVAVVNDAPPPDVFLSRDQFEACQSARGCELLPLALSRWISVSCTDIDAEAAWLSL